MEFDDMFNDVVTAKQKFAAKVLRVFVDGPKSGAEVSKALGVGSGGDVTSVVPLPCDPCLAVWLTPSQRGLKYDKLQKTQNSPQKMKRRRGLSPQRRGLSPSFHYDKW